MTARLWITIVIEMLLIAALLFGAAGTLRWIAGWVYLAVLFGTSVPMAWWLARYDPALVRERLKPPIQPGQPPWDRVVVSALLVAVLLWLPLMGLDAVRFGWSAIPVWTRAIGGVGLLASLWLSWRTLRENTFLALAVRIQTERGHHVVSTGPYAVIRHPLYAAAIVYFFATALMLGSGWGVAGAAALGGLLALRAALEDRELHRRLAGYPDYAARVRHRLMPGLW